MVGGSNIFLKINFVEVSAEEYTYSRIDPKRSFPFADSPVGLASIKKGATLTEGADVKAAVALRLEIPPNLRPENSEVSFQPGDTIRVIPRNNGRTVEGLLQRLKLTEVAHKPCVVEVSKKVPAHLHQGVTTIRNIFSDDVDLYSVPKKLFLKSLLPYTSDAADQALLQEVCSNSQAYLDFVATKGRSLPRMLESVGSCEPPVELLFQYLPPLQPRPYSIASSPLNGSFLEIIFGAVEHEDGSPGVCTGFLMDTFRDKSKVPFYFSKPNPKFRLPLVPSVPIILIATGTGIAPFRCFLQNLSFTNYVGSAQSDGDLTVHDVWLFYGCRYEKKDFLYKPEIKACTQDGCLNFRLTTAFSRDAPNSQKVYVQHRIEENGCEFTHWVVDRKAQVYVCGNSKHMFKDVEAAVTNNLVKYAEKTAEEAALYLQVMKGDLRFCTDTWSG